MGIENILLIWKWLNGPGILKRYHMTKNSHMHIVMQRGILEYLGSFPKTIRDHTFEAEVFASLILLNELLKPKFLHH